MSYHHDSAAHLIPAAAGASDAPTPLDTLSVNGRAGRSSADGSPTANGNDSGLPAGAASSAPRDDVEGGLVVIPTGEGDAAHARAHPDRRLPFSWRKLWAMTGPGWLMSLAYIDPGNLESDLQAGAVSGYALIWILFWSTVMGGALQIFSAQLGVITGRHLAEIARDEYARWPRIVLWLMAELAIIGSDIQEVVGSSIALNILFGLPLWAGVLITVLDTFTFLFLHRWGIRKLEAFFCTLIGVMAVCFVVEFSIGKPDGAGIVKGWVVPDIPRSAVLQAVGMLGSVIMPHNLFLHSALVQSRAVDRTSKVAVRDANMYFAIESVAALAVSFLINLCVLAVFAAGFFVAGTPNNDVGLSNAGDVLRERFGEAARVIWAIGLLAAGQASTMTGTFAGQFVMNGFLHLKIARWKRTALTRSCAVIPALIVALSFSSDLDTLSEWLNVLQSIQLPFAVIPLLKFCKSERIVGPAFAHGRCTQALSAVIVALTVGINAYLVVAFVQDTLPPTWATYLIVSVLGIAYCAFLSYIALSPSAAVSAAAAGAAPKPGLLSAGESGRHFAPVPQAATADIPSAASDM